MLPCLNLQVCLYPFGNGGIYFTLGHGPMNRMVRLSLAFFDVRLWWQGHGAGVPVATGGPLPAGAVKQAVPWPPFPPPAGAVAKVIYTSVDYPGWGCACYRFTDGTVRAIGHRSPLELEGAWTLSVDEPLEQGEGYHAHVKY